MKNIHHVEDIAFWLTTAIIITAIGVLASTGRCKGKGWLLSCLILSLVSHAGFYVPNLLRRNEVISIGTYREFIETAGITIYAISIGRWALLLAFLFSWKSVKESTTADASASTSGSPPPPLPVEQMDFPITTISVAPPGKIFCRNCCNLVDEFAIACPKCGVPPKTQKNYCHRCGKPTSTIQIICTKCGALLDRIRSKSRVIAGFLGLFMGGFGIHKFYLGYNGTGVFMLIAWLFPLLLEYIGGATFNYASFGIVSGILTLIGGLEGIIYFTKSDQEFSQTYIQNRKNWF